MNQADSLVGMEEVEEREPFCETSRDALKGLRFLHLPGILLERQMMYESGGFMEEVEERKPFCERISRC
jgi:hypothetical protein